MLNQKDRLNYRVKLEDDFTYAKLKQSEFLSMYSDYEKSMHALYRLAKYNAKTQNEHAEINQYTKNTLSYLDKLNEKCSKQRSLIYEINKYKDNSSKGQFEVIKTKLNELNSHSINYPRFDEFKRGAVRKPKTETNQLLKSIESNTIDLHNELSINQSIINDLVETITLFESSGQYDGIDYEREYQYAQSMVSVCDDIIQDKKNSIMVSENKLTQEDISFTNKSIAYYEDKKEEYTKFIGLYNDVVEQHKLPKFDVNINLGYKPNEVFDQLTDSLSISTAEFNRENNQLNHFLDGVLPLKFEFLI